MEGSLAIPGSWPWQVRIIKSKNLRGHCGGSVVHPQLILTAAHCVEQYSRYVRSSLALEIFLLLIALLWV